MPCKHPTVPPLPSRGARLRRRRACALAALALLAACQDRESTLEAEKAAAPAAAARSLTTVSPERPAAFAIYPDIEPAIITQMRSGVEHQVTVWMEFTQGISSPSQLVSSHFASGNGRHNFLGKLSGYNGRYADPWLAQEKGTARQRIYLVGVTTGNALADSNALVRWYSDNGGYSWSAPAAIIKYAKPAPYFVDKPAVAVSAAAGSAGYVYVVCNREPSTSTSREQVIQVSTDGGTTWKGPFPVGNQASGHHNAPQVMVDSNGDVYVLWVRWRATQNGDSLHIARSPAYNPATNTMTFTEGPKYSIGRVNNANSTFPCGTDCKVRAASVPIARLDAVRRRIAVAWHDTRETGGTDIYFTTVSIPGMAWAPRIALPWNGGNDVQPSMDFDAQGNYLISYYAFGLNSPIYYNVARYVSFATGTPVVEDAGQSVPLLSATPSDVSKYPVDANGMRLLGEYHDVSFSNGTFKTVGIQIVEGTGNPYVFTTTHN